MQKLDKTYGISMKGSQTFDLNAGTINKKNVLSGNTIEAKLSRTFTAGEKEFKWSTTNPDIVKIVGPEIAEPKPAEKGNKSVVNTKIAATGIGTAYNVLTGTDKVDKTKVNMAVMKVVVKATAPSVYFTNDALGLLSDDQKTLTITAGSYDKLFYAVYTDNHNVELRYNTTEAVKISGSGGVTVKNGVLYAKKVTKPNKPAKVTLQCGKSKTILWVTVK